MVDSPVRRCRKGAQNVAPGSCSAEDAGGGAHFGPGLMGRRRSSFENVDLQDCRFGRRNVEEDDPRRGRSSQKWVEEATIV